MAKPQANRSANDLVKNLTAVAVHQSHGFTAPQVVNILACEDTSKNCAQRAADTVYSECVEGIVISKNMLYFAHHQVAHDSAS